MVYWEAFNLRPVVVNTVGCTWAHTLIYCLTCSLQKNMVCQVPTCFILDSFYCVWGHNAKTVITQKGINWWVIEREYEVGWNLFKYHIVWFLELTTGINCTKEFQSIWSAMFKFWHVTNSLPALWLEFNTMGCRVKWFSLFPWNSYGEKIKTKLNSFLPHQTILFILTFREVGLAAWYLGCCQMT